MALAPTPTRSAAPVAGCARRIRCGASTTELILDDGREVTLPGRPDLVGARHCVRSLNHVASVRIEGSATRTRARLRGIGNRLPVDLAIAVTTALALVDSGVPAIVALTEVDA